MLDAKIVNQIGPVFAPEASEWETKGVCQAKLPKSGTRLATGAVVSVFLMWVAVE